MTSAPRKAPRATVVCEPFDVDDAQAEAILNYIGDLVIERAAERKTIALVPKEITR